ncbi:MAG TPA: OmpH family outer membrane protein [Pyrinomonadaceae bacterium]|jgi:Skp family chaperone for outer membrane proteins
MKRIRLISAALMLAAIVTISASAQTRPGTAAGRPAAPQTPAASNAPVPDTKIAFIDTGMFGEEKGGINRYVTAVKSVEREFQPRQTELTGIQTRIKALADEISKLSGNSVVDPKTIQAKQDEGERLQRDLKYKKDQADADFSKRYQEVVAPISTDIGKALDQFAQQRGITMILDISKLAPAILTVNPAMDVTQAFIAEFNSKNPVTASAASPK